MCITIHGYWQWSNQPKCAPEIAIWHYKENMIYLAWVRYLQIHQNVKYWSHVHELDDSKTFTGMNPGVDFWLYTTEGAHMLAVIVALNMGFEIQYNNSSHRIYFHQNIIYLFKQTHLLMVYCIVCCRNIL